MAAIVGIGSSASWRQTSWSSWCRSRPASPRLLLELADVRAGRERALATPADHDRPDVVGRLDRPERVAKLEDELPGEQVERRVGQLEVGDPAELERDELAHDAAPKSAARPIGPSHRAGDPSSAARRRRGAGSPSGPGRRVRRRSRGDLDQDEAVRLEREHGALGDVADLLAALAGEPAAERDLADLRHELAELAVLDDPDPVADLELEALGGQRADEVDPRGLRAQMFGKPPGPRTRPSKAWTLTLPSASTSANERLAMSSPPPS